MRVIDSTLRVVLVVHQTDAYKAVDMGSGSGLCSTGNSSKVARVKIRRNR